MREKVRYFAGLGGRQDDIAKMIGCAAKTLRKRFRSELADAAGNWFPGEGGQSPSAPGV